MTRLLWDQVGEKTYETGVDRGVLFIPNNLGVYTTGVAWNGLTKVTESPSGAESNKQYADNTVYLNLLSLEQFSATIEAYTYPDEWNQFDGLAEPNDGVFVGQQNRKSFGLCYRTIKGNDVDANDFSYKLHLLYGCLAAPSEKAYATTPVNVTGLKPTSLIVVDSSVVDAGALSDLEDALYGDATTGVAHLPLPDAVIAMFDAP
jgi:hypothetical protein